MSNIKVQGNVSGTGSLTIAAPNTNSDRTLTLPDQTGTLMATGGGPINVSTSAAADSMTLDASGNLGVGTSSPVNKLDVNGGVVVEAGNEFAANVYYSGGWKYRGNGWGGYIKPSDGSGNTIFAQFANNSSGAGAAGTELERMRIDSIGNVGIGTSSPTAPYRMDIVSGVSRSLRVRGTSPGSYGADSAVLVSAANDAAVEFYNDSTGKYWRVVQDGSGNFDFAVSTVTNSFTHTFYDSGAAAKRDGAGSWIGTSDERLKTNFAPITASEAWTRISKLNPTKYQWAVQESHSNQAGDQFGFKAQDWQKAYPTSVYEMVPSEGEKHLIPEGEKALGLAFNADFYADLVAVIKEQQAIITQLQADVAALKGAA